MKKYLKLLLVMLVALLALATSPLSAAEKVKIDKLTVKTLPADVYPLLQKGKNLSLFWKGPEFAPSRKFKAGEIAWKADNRVSEVSTTLKAQIGDLASPGGFYTLEMAVTEAQAGVVRSVGSNTAGFYILEGQVKDPDGKVVGAFVTREESEWAGLGQYSLKPGVERSLSGIASELFK